MVITDKKKIVLVLAVMIIGCLAAFGRVAGNGFINFDDPGYITQNDHVQSGFTIENMKWAFTSTVESNWHPLTWLSHILDWKIFAGNAGGHHLASLFLHTGSALLLFFFLYRTTQTVWPAGLAAALFALHPLRVESVAWAAERKDVLSMFFGLASIYAYALYAENSRCSRYLACLMFFVLSLMAKPMLVTLPFVFLLLDYWPLNRWQKIKFQSNEYSIRKLLWEKAPFIMLTAFSSIITVWAQHQGGTFARSLPFSDRIFNAIITYVSYLEKMFWPFNLAVFYPYPDSPAFWKIMLLFCILGGATVTVVYTVRTLPFLFVGWFWYLGTLIPVIGLVQVGSQAMADRYTYFPLIGVAIILAWSIDFFIKNKQTGKNFLIPVCTGILVVLALLTWQQCGYWKNDLALFGHALRVTQKNALAHNQMGLAYFEAESNKEALYHFDRAILLNHNQDSAYNNRGAVYLKSGNDRKALSDFNHAIFINPSYIKAYNNRANLYAQTGHHELAIDDLTKTIRLDPDYINGYYNRGLLFAKLGRYQPALKDLDEAIRLKEDYADAYNLKAAVYLNQNDMVSGCRDAKKACMLGNCATMNAAQTRGLCR